MQKITVGIATFNEEQNILNLLHSLASQESRDFIISEVIISDDSSDNTVEIVNRFVKDNPSLNVKCIHHSDRRGVNNAWNEIFENSSGDIIVLYDGDVIMEKNATQELVSSIHERIVACASNPVPIQAQGIAGRATVFISNWLRCIRRIRPSQYTLMGRSLSIRADIAKSIRFPRDLIAVDLYIHCKVVEYGLCVAYNDKATVYFRPPLTIADLSSQVIRGMNGHKQLVRDLEKSRIVLPVRVALSQAIRNAYSDPLGALCILLCYCLFPYYKFSLKGLNSGKWRTAQSTKSINSNTLSFPV